VKTYIRGAIELMSSNYAQHGRLGKGQKRTWTYLRKDEVKR